MDYFPGFQIQASPLCVQEIRICIFSSESLSVCVSSSVPMDKNYGFFLWSRCSELIRR